MTDKGLAEPTAGARPLPGSVAGHALRYGSDVDLSDPNGTLPKQLALVGRGRKVLEVGSATGYMTRAMQAAGCAVTALELDPEAAAQAAEYCDRMIVGNVEAIDLESALGDDEFDVILFGDVLEHLVDPVGVLTRTAAFLAEGGRVVASLPNVAHGSVRLALLAGRFEYQEMGLLDRTHLHMFTAAGIEEMFSKAGLTIRQWQSVEVDPLETELELKHHSLPAGLVGVVRSDPEAQIYQYVVEAVTASDLPAAEAPQAELDDSRTLHGLHRVDEELQRLRDLIEERQRAFEEELAEVQRAVEVKEARVVKLDHAWRDAEARLAQATEQFEAAQSDLLTARGQLSAAMSEAAQLKAQLEAIHRSWSWRLLRIYRALLRRVPFATRVYGRVRRALGERVYGAAVAAPEPAPAVPIVALPACERPVVSIVIPVHNQLEATRRCLDAIVANTSGVPYEVIVVDDGSSDGTAEYLAMVPNLMVATNPSAQGYLRATNAGAGRARGPMLVLLNNDTEVRAGWLKALIDTMESDPTVAMVGAKLLYRDLSLQEAGGIIYRDGTGCNYGRGDDPGRWKYNFTREVDYCSAACVLVRREVFDRLGGFDERFVPAYYEDTDLAFSIRKLGYKVMYQPQAEVIHDEGTSSGTDVTAGIKRYQEVNREQFVRKWEAELLSQPPAEGNALIVRERPRDNRLLIVDATVPTFDHDSGSLRMDSLITALDRMGYAITFLPDNRNPLQPYTSRLQQRGIEVLYGEYDLVEWLQAFAPSVRMCLASRPSVAWKYLATVREYAPECRFVFDTVDLHYLRESRRAEAEGKAWLSRLAAGYKELELGLVRAADASLTVTPDERELILAEVPDSTIHVIPNVHMISAETTPFAGRRDLLFVGGFNHPPNAAAVRFFVQEVLPEVLEELPDVRLHVVGSFPPEDIKQLASAQVDVTGYVSDLTPYLQGCRVSVAPLTYGAGLKGKVTQALSVGLPVVTTSIGAEGTGLQNGRDALIADDPHELARHVVRLYRDEQLWTGMATAGLQLAEENFSVAAVARLVTGLLEDLEIPIPG